MSTFLKPENPLWLPTGSVRALSAFGGLVVAAVLVFQKIPVPDWYLVLLTGIVGDYFNLRRGK